MQGVKDTLWGFATLKHRPSDAFLLASARHCYDRLAQFNSQNVANVTWAYAKLGHHPGLLLDAFATQMVANRQASGLRILNPKPKLNVCFFCYLFHFLKCVHQSRPTLCYLAGHISLCQLSDCLIGKICKLLLRHCQFFFCQAIKVAGPCICHATASLHSCKQDKIETNV